MKITVNSDGTVVASNADEGKQNPLVAPSPAQPNGMPVSPAVDTWTFNDPDQAGKFLRGQNLKAHPLNKAPAGDVSAALDAANEYVKQLES